MSAAVDFSIYPPVNAPGDGSWPGLPGRGSNELAGSPRRLTLVPSPPQGLRALPPVEAAPRLGQASWRLTRRGKIAATLAVFALGLGLLGVARASAPSRSQVSTRSGVVAVQPGDTLWSIAEKIDPAGDPRNTIANLRALNQLSTVELTPGQVLRVG